MIETGYVDTFPLRQLIPRCNKRTINPGNALTPLEQGEILFMILGSEPKFLKVPIEIMDFVIGVLDSVAKIFPAVGEAAEFGKIGITSHRVC
ncbi:unnamed protein product [Brassica rapa subsp. trilocularis]|uniref:Uncharacterized protein n=1 Tax=Brassica campestris TaxID=3711 RepID=M4CQI2_BRACM